MADPIPISRAEYAAKFGAAPASSSEPIPITRGEYAAKFGLGEAPEKPFSLFNETAALVNRGIEGVGAAADFWEMLERNFNPIRLGGPRALGLNQNPLNDPPQKPLSAYLKEGARYVNAYGDEKAESIPGKFLEPVVELAASSIGPGATSKTAMKQLGRAGAVGGALNVFDVDKDTQAVAELGAATLPDLLKGGAKIGTKLLGLGDKAERSGKALQRTALGVTAHDYTKSVDELGPWVLDEPDKVTTRVESALNSLIDENAFNGNFEPKNIFKTAVVNQVSLGKQIDKVIRAADDIKPGPIIPTFDNAQAYIASGKVENPESARKLVANIARNIAEDGQGSLPYIQQQKIVFGGKYEKGKPDLNGLYRAMYHDLKNTIEVYAPEVAGLNKQLQKWEIARPIIDRSIGADSKKNIVDGVINMIKTTGGTFTTPTVLSALGLGTFGPGIAIPGMVLTAAATRPGRAKIGGALAGLNKMPGLPGNVPVGAANLFSDQAEIASQDQGGRTPQSSSSKSSPQGTAQGAPQSQNLSDLVATYSNPRPNSLGAQASPISLVSPGLSGDLFDLSSRSILDLGDDMGGNPKDVAQVEQAIDSDPYYSALYEAESGRNPKAKNPESSASGGFQFIKSTAKSLGLKDPMDLADSFAKVQTLTDQHRGKVGDNPALLYSAHYLGIGLLTKALSGQKLTDREAKQVQYLDQKALPRFMKIYERIMAKKSGSVEA